MEEVVVFLQINVYVLIITILVNLIIIKGDQCENNALLGLISIISLPFLTILAISLLLILIITIIIIIIITIFLIIKKINNNIHQFLILGYSPEFIMNNNNNIIIQNSDELIELDNINEK
jgi:hypothetical protein